MITSIPNLLQRFNHGKAFGSFRLREFIKDP